jgi:hypothetical protein
VDDDDDDRAEKAIEQVIRGACWLIARGRLDRFQAAKPQEAPPSRSVRELNWLNATTENVWAEKVAQAREIMSADPHLDSVALAELLDTQPAPGKDKPVHPTEPTAAASARLRAEHEAHRQAEERAAQINAERKARADELLAKMSAEEADRILAEVRAELGEGARAVTVAAAVRERVLAEADSEAA